MLSAIIWRAAGQHLVDFLMPRLFEPLGIERPVWETCPMGIAAGGMGLSLRTEDVAKFGQMLLDKGKYEGKTIVSEAYVALATQEQSDNRQGAAQIDSAQGYGYQFHLCHRGCFRGAGAFGQLCFVAPEQRIVIAATSAFAKNSEESQTLLDLIYEHIIDEKKSNAIRPLTDDSVALQQRLAKMTYPVPEARLIPNDIPDLNRHCYMLEDNPEKLRMLRFSCSDERLEVRLYYEQREQRVLAFDFRGSVHIQDVFEKDLAIHRQDAVTYAIWHDRMTLKLTMLYIETPYCVNYTIQFKDRSIELHYQKNVSMTFRGYLVSGILMGIDHFRLV